MRRHDRIDVAAKVKSADFGKGVPEHPVIAAGLRAEINEASGQLRRNGDKIIPSHDAEIIVRWNKTVYTAWQDKRAIRVSDLALDDVWHVQSMHRFRKGRLWHLKMRCTRAG